MIAAGDAARDVADWRAAASAYEAVLTAQPRNAAIWVQFGHALKEMGDRSGAERAYRAAIAIAPQIADTHLQLGHVLKLEGRRDEAVASYGEALRLAPDLRAARDELIHFGARNALPAGFHSMDRYAHDLAGIAAMLKQSVRAMEEWIAVSAYPLAAYDAFRNAFPIAPPPPIRREPGLDRITPILIDAADASAASIRATLHSLRDQSVPNWQAYVLAPPAILNHPVASFAHVDGRIRFIDHVLIDRTDAGDLIDIDESQYALSLSGGTALDPQALAWFAFTAARTNCAAVYCDDDQAIDHWRYGRQFSAPSLRSVFDIDVLAATSHPPAALLFNAGLLRTRPAALREGWGTPAAGSEIRRMLTISASCDGPVAHIPRILATRMRLPEQARHAPGAPQEQSDALVEPVMAIPQRLSLAIVNSAINLIDVPVGGWTRKVGVSPLRRTDERLLVVIPTRDEPEMLRECIDSLREKARLADRIDIVVVDNRSTLPETRALLDHYAASGILQVEVMDEPFNWSRANNLGARRSEAANLLFLNNDTQMLTAEWDEYLLGYLQREDVGIVGARLLYPDLTIQHAGMVFGVGDTPSVHEGVGLPSSEGGPGDRWVLTRATGAVTGAFMATRRSVYEAVKGFDEQDLFIGYNDIDFCFNVRAIGLKVLYAPVIELIHHESKSRGINDTRGKVAWDHAELSALYDRWGEALVKDPGYNPQWALRGQPFDGLREPTMRQILRHIDSSATDFPWRVQQGQEEWS